MMDVLNLAHGALFLGGAYLAVGVCRRRWRAWGVRSPALAVAGGGGPGAGGVLSLLTGPLRRGPPRPGPAHPRGGPGRRRAAVGVFGDDVQLGRAAPARPGRVGPAFGASTRPTGSLVIARRGWYWPLVVYLRGRADPGRRAGPGDGRRPGMVRRSAWTPAGHGGVFAAGVGAGRLGGRARRPRSTAPAPGLDETVLILALVVVVIGGLGSVRGALLGALLIGQVDRPSGRVAAARSYASFPVFAALALVLRAAAARACSAAGRGGAAVTDRPEAPRRTPAVACVRPRRAAVGRLAVASCCCCSLRAAAGARRRPRPTPDAGSWSSPLLAVEPGPADRGDRAALAGAGGLLRGRGLHGRAGCRSTSPRTRPVQLLAGLGRGLLAAALTGWVAVRGRGVVLPDADPGDRRDRCTQVADTWEGRDRRRPTAWPGCRRSPCSAARRCSPPGSSTGTCWRRRGRRVRGGGAGRRASPFGRTLRGIRDNEAADARPRLPARSLARYGGVLPGRRGRRDRPASLWVAAAPGSSRPADLGFEVAALALLAVVIGGAGSLWGPCLGAALVRARPRRPVGPSSAGTAPLVLGLVFVAVVYLLPRGVAGLRRRDPPSDGRARHDAPCWSCAGLTRALRVADGRRRRRLSVAAGRPARPDRAERRRQVDAVRAGHRDAAPRPPGPSPSTAQDVTALPEAAPGPARHAPDVPALQPVPSLPVLDNVALAVQRARRRRAWPCCDRAATAAAAVRGRGAAPARAGRAGRAGGGPGRGAVAR